ncbi:TPA: Bro-N domain-containing protein [Streptococcus suis]|uniref:BRO-N domain-containing protein n=1 Tax=Streptococcus suis TaxID=1307 RepID=UPI0006980F46|nr:Bro-N domain-containing protein [Streptococcus suis]MCB2915168.1 Bro-N domain-containing protein [Streptococcus suis]MCB2920986.1 Bro-N domain-containing protein [Streptococcus suis]MCQ8270492.1 Bro-N domain-containing protein [Streptococcus suis]MDW8659872.1 Bro-N domain-containing protein [Streptococcus suis]MDW8686888.1 Bro-N domain-containing protein [Streptococcus suis]
MRRNYSKVIEKMRTIHGLNLVAIGQRIGTDPRTVGKWAQGKHQPNKDSRKKINNLYREVKQSMTTQTTIEPFEDFYDWSKMKKKKPTTEVIATQQFGNKSFEIYGNKDNPLFIAVEVAEMIEVQNTTDLLKRIDEDEKLTYVISRAGQKREVNMLTEFGLYEVLFQSRKPKAKEFKKVVKNILKEIRVNGYYMQGELIQDQPTQSAIELNSDMAYIKNRLAELQSMTTMADIKIGLAKTYRIAELMED